MGGDPNLSPVIDNLAGLRALLNNAIQSVYRDKAGEQKFTHDISVRHTVTIGSGTGTCPDEIMREFLPQANITDENSSLVSYKIYAVDATQETFDQLGYLWLVGDTFHYTAPSPDLDDFSGSLYVTVPSFPAFPASMADDIPMDTDTTNDVIMWMAQALRNPAAAV
jgi:hypothetical protein